MKQLKFNRPYPKQWEFYKSRTRYTAYGGARSGGKTAQRAVWRRPWRSHAAGKVQGSGRSAFATGSGTGTGAERHETAEI